jgi:hypothetical protein
VETIELQLDEQMLDLAPWLAELRHSSLSELIAEAINKLAEAEPPKDRILGMFADEPEIVDEILEEIMSERTAHS